MKRASSSPAAAFYIFFPFAVALFVANFTPLPPVKLFMTAIFISAVLLWFTEALPVAVTALLVPTLAVLYGVETSGNAFRGYSNDIIFLFIGVFFLAAGMQKHGLDKRMAYIVLTSKVGSHSFLALAFLLGLLSYVLSMWVSNTATAAMLVPIALGIAAAIDEKSAASRLQSNSKVFLLLLIAYSTSAGGIATPIGTPPNLLLIGFLAERGIHIDFIQWVLFALPLSIAMFLSIFGVLYVLFPPPKAGETHLSELRENFIARKESLGKMRREEWFVALCFSLAVIFWIVPGLVESLFSGQPVAEWARQFLPMSVVAIIVGSLLFVLPGRSGHDERVLSWRDAREIDWATVLLFGGGLCLGNLLQSTGVAGDIGKNMLHLVGSNVWLLVVVGAAVTLLFTEVASNTASASIFISILLGALPEQATILHYAPLLAVCFAASLGFMLPIGTPPNAIVFGTGEVQIKQMIRAGAVLNVIGFLLIVGYLYFFESYNILLL